MFDGIFAVLEDILYVPNLASVWFDRIKKAE